MSDPEIARRCTACGVSVRERAVFCPQCGDPISQGSTMVSDTAPTEALRPDLGATQPLTPKVSEDGVRSRVEKFRKVSSVMLDQAAYDPSLRFLLVAAFMFLLFLVLLILSKVLG